MRRTAFLLVTIALAGCSRHAQVAKAEQTMAMLDAAPVARDAPAQTPAVAGPRIAYTYSITYAFTRRNVGEVQGRQLAMCRQLGPARCLVLKSSLNTPGPNDHIVMDQAELLIDARQAGDINQKFDALAAASGASVANRQVEAEDVARQVIDTDAKVRAKQALAGRLLTIVQTSKGKVGELVEAERAYAATQEELDAARGEQADLARRVAMSRLTITYAFDDTPGRDSPIIASLAGAGQTLTTSVAALVTASVAILPWLIALVTVLALIRWVRHRMGWRWPRRARPTAPTAAAD